MKGYAFPPFVLIGRVLAKVRKDNATLVLITPLWQAQPWFPTLLQLSIATPILLPQSSDLLSDPKGHPHPLITKNRLPLVAWKVSGTNSLIREFQSKLPLLSRNAEEKDQSQQSIGLGKWSSWCGQRQVDPFNASLNSVLHLLTNMFDKNYQYRTINNQGQQFLHFTLKLKVFLWVNIL